MGLFIIVMTVLGAVSVADYNGNINLTEIATKTSEYKVLDQTPNASNPELTDITIVKTGKTYTVKVTPLDYSKLND